MNCNILCGIQIQENFIICMTWVQYEETVKKLHGNIMVSTTMIDLKNISSKLLDLLLIFICYAYILNCLIHVVCTVSRGLQN